MSLLSLGDLDAAEAVLDRTSADARAALGERHLLTLRARLLQSQVQRFRGRIEEQRATLAELLPMLRERAREDATLPVVGSQYLTLNAIDRGAYGEAAAAVEGERLAAERLGERHPEMVASAILLALAHRYQRRFDLALPAAERALRLTRAAYPGPGLHPRVVEARAVRGRALGDVGRLVEGIGELQAARDDALQLFGNNSPLVGTLQQNPVAYLVDLGELAAAELNARESVRIVKLHAQAESFSHAGTLASLGAVLLAQRRADEALALLAPAADTLARVLGPGHDAALLEHAHPTPRRMPAELIDLLGYSAAGLVLATFSVRSITALRSVAIARNVLFMVYAGAAQLVPIFMLHAALLPLNLRRLHEARSVARAALAGQPDPKFFVGGQTSRLGNKKRRRRCCPGGAAQKVPAGRRMHSRRTAPAQRWPGNA